MENILKPKPFTERDRAYYRQRYKNRMFSAITQLFAEEAELNETTKRDLARWLECDPSQITRWLSAPSNLTMETTSDILLALGAEEDPTIRRFAEKSVANYMHPLVERSLNASRMKLDSQGGTTSAQTVIIKISPTQDEATTVPRPSRLGEANIAMTG